MAPRYIVPRTLLVYCFYFTFTLSNVGVQGRRLALGAATTQMEEEQATIVPTGKVGRYVEEWAVCFDYGGVYYGAKATISLHALPSTQSNQTSASAIWVSASLPGQLGAAAEPINTIAAGWHVSPELYGDTRTRLFTYWSLDFFEETGCYNLGCPGFVLASDSPVGPGHILAVHRNEEQYITLTVYKQNNSGDWWLLYRDSDQVITDVVVGYWPQTLFTSLAKKANTVEFGGFVKYLEDTQSPPMGSGHNTGERHGNAACVKDMQYLNTDGNFTDLEMEDLMIASDDPSCYNTSLRVSYGQLYFDFGGPGAC